MSDLENLLERFRRAPEIIAVISTGVFGDEIDFVPAPGKWNIRQITRHLADSEIVGAYRLRSVIAENNPTITGYDQAAWVANLDYDKRKPASSLEFFRRVRADTYELLKDLAPSAFDRKATHTERGEITLLQLVQMHTEHAEEHARQLQSVREAYKLTKAKK